MKKVCSLLATVMFLALLVPRTSLGEETERNGFFMRPVGTYGGVVTSTEGVDVGDGLGGGLSLGYNFARGWIGGIEGGVTYTHYSTRSYNLPYPYWSLQAVPDKMEVIDIFFGGIFGGSLGPVDLYANIGFDLPVTNLGGWDPYLGVKVGGGIDFWILDWLAVGATGNFIWGYSLGDAYNYYSSEFDNMSRYMIQFGPKFRF